jgi:hypothetical protein
VIARSAALSLLLLAAAPTGASAAPADRVRVPDGWNHDADRGARLAPHLARESHFGGVTLDGSEVAVWSAPDGGAALIVSIVRAPAPADLPAAVRAELDLVKSAPDAAGLDGSRVVRDRWDERVVGGAVEATLAWRHEGHGSTSASRTLIAARADGIERITGECVSAAAIAPACTAALASLTPGIPEGQRVAIAIGATAAVAAPSPAGVPARAPAQLGDGSHLSLPPIQVETRRAADKRPFYVIGALLLLGAIFLWNRARAARLGADAGRRWRRDASTADKGESS